MWLPTFLQRGIHFFGERTEVLAFNNFVLFDRVHLPIIGKRAAVVEEDLLSVREPVRANTWERLGQRVSIQNSSSLIFFCGRSVVYVSEQRINPSNPYEGCQVRRVGEGD
jgi:hypothetical protein